MHAVQELEDRHHGNEIVAGQGIQTGQCRPRPRVTTFGRDENAGIDQRSQGEVR